MVILVCGGREYDNYGSVSETLDEVVSWATDPGAVKIINDGRRGAAQLASRWAKEKGFPFIEGDSVSLIDQYRPDQGVVFPGGQVTEYMLLRLFRANVNTWVIG